MFELPVLAEEVPVTIDTGRLPAPLAKLGYTMANAGMLDPADLRTGRAGARRMIERAWQRWQREDHLPVVRELPVHFIIVDPDDYDGTRVLSNIVPNTAWLVAIGRKVRKWYVGEGCERLIRQGRPELAEHALAVLYDGLDAICYAPKPPEFYAWAKHFWWKGGEDVPKGSNFPSRRKFDFRYAPISVAPRRHPRELENMKRGWRRFREHILAVDKLSRHPDLLRPNIHEFTDGPAWDLALFVRWKHGDYLHRLLDDYWHHAERANGQKPWFAFQGAWPLATAADIARARRGIAANTRLAAALVDLVNDIGWVANISLGGY